MKTKIKIFTCLLVGLPVFAYDGKASKAIEGKSLGVEEVKLINSPSSSNADEDDFAAIRRRQYGNNTKEFYYFSRWHKYLEEVAEEKARKEAYDKEVAKINAENEKIRAYNNSLSEGSTVDVSSLNNENVADSKKD